MWGSRRDPSALTNGKKKEVAAEELNSEPDNGKVKATRNILLIRHSQYNLSGSSDRERILTPLGLTHTHTHLPIHSTTHTYVCVRSGPG